MRSNDGMSDKDKKKHATEPGKDEYIDEVSQEAIDRTVSEIESADSGRGAAAADTDPPEEGHSGSRPHDSAKHHKHQEELEKARAQAKEMQERYLRSAADLENFRKRAAKETEENRRFANEELIKSLLPIVDNLERALSHGEGKADSGALLEGVRMVHKQFMDTLGKFGVEQIDSLGKPFDPNFHQALMQVKTNESPPNTVVTEVSKGYLLAGRLVRPSMVGVSVAEDRAPAQESPWGDEEFRKEEDVPDATDGDTRDKTE
jgi:molecular chaperone GrpE